MYFTASTPEEFDPSNYVILPADATAEELLDQVIEETSLKPDNALESGVIGAEPPCSLGNATAEALEGSAGLEEALSLDQTATLQGEEILHDANLTDINLSAESLSYQKVYVVPANKGQKQNIFFLVNK